MIFQMCCRSMILKFFIFPELFQLTKIILFEDGRHDLNRKEKLLSFILPLVCSIKSTAKKPAKKTAKKAEKTEEKEEESK